MATCLLLIAILVVATITDVRSHHIFNWTTYPGLLLGLLWRTGTEGWAGLEDAAAGFGLCGAVMLVCFVLFNLGGGDLKLITMMGTWLGWQRGFEALLWTFVLGGAMGLSRLIWQLGAGRIILNTFYHLSLLWRAKSWVPLNAEDREPLQQTLFLAPSALIATLIVTAEIWLPPLSSSFSSLTTNR